MATQTVQFTAAAGQTGTCKLFAPGSDVQVASVAITEATNRTGTYTAAFTDVAAGTFQVLILSTGGTKLADWWVELLLATGTYFAKSEYPGTSSGSIYTVIERSVNDTNPITFSWPVAGAVISGSVSKDNAIPYVNVAGARAFLRTEGGKHYYTLAYNSADRPTAEGTARYAFTDDTYTRYVTLRVGPSITASLTTQMTESYAADGVAPTLAQAVFLIQQHLSESAISSTTKTVKKLDGTTSAATFTLDSATDPTSITRST